MSTSADIWEVMADEISAHPHDRLEMFRGRDQRLDAFFAYGSTGAAEVLSVAKIDPDTTQVVDAESELTAACARYDVTVEEVHNSRVRHTAVIAARVSIATRLSASGWTGVAIGRFLFRRKTNLSHMLRGGRGKGTLPSSRIAKDLVARRLRPQLRPRPRSGTLRGYDKGNRGCRQLDQAAWALQHLRDVGEEQLIQRLVEKHYPKLTLRQVYKAAFGDEPAPLTLDEAHVAEARGEGVVRFVNGTPQWFRAAPLPRMLLDRAAPHEQASLDESRLPRAV